ncbi:hypothetical protein RHMOL_Rhmol02G0058900 [Rhododendron molle]|uniref:Uncharacterized protein n=1 Tax=Rhododendron molle TaxID=49168 RepID=A0ACC0PNF7_RHOML|nr:hypothetical protein RHMOL_Rhmol02G0058900 [Rhododendron molle]
MNVSMNSQKLQTCQATTSCPVYSIRKINGHTSIQHWLQYKKNKWSVKLSLLVWISIS